jgi:hypothetical protein
MVNLPQADLSIKQSYQSYAIFPLIEGLSQFCSSAIFALNLQHSIICFKFATFLPMLLLTSYMLQY